ncbi:hypothetical protein H0H93_011426 [Arthromyces matolae]|nr:hypothetical protein H0H93_011426 [Arthromyces matolae]
MSLILLFSLVLALTVSGNPVVVREPLVKSQLTRRLNITSIHNLVRHDVARAKFLRARAEAKLRGESDFDPRAVVEEQVDNQAVTYIASVGVGSPATTYQLLVDTGSSSNTWVGATQRYVRTSTSVQTSNRVSVTYGSGSFSGNEFTDTVTITPSLVLPAQSIGVASRSSGFEGTDGIIGIGPVDLTLGTLSPATNTLIPTVTDNAFSLGLITSDLLGISFQPSTSDEPGEITWGVTLELTANAQLWPRALNTAIGGNANRVYLIVGNLGTPSGEGFDFVNGFAFLERFYAVFDTTNKRVGFATTSSTDATSN